jgi:hypothetical protein
MKIEKEEMAAYAKIAGSGKYRDDEEDSELESEYSDDEDEEGVYDDEDESDEGDD